MALTLELRLAERRAVASDDDELGLARSERFERRLESQGDLTRLDDESEAGIDRIRCLLGLAWRHLDCWIDCRVLRGVGVVCWLFAMGGLGHEQVEGLARDHQSIIISYLCCPRVWSGTVCC